MQADQEEEYKAGKPAIEATVSELCLSQAVTMASQRAAHKLHAVTLIRSGIGRPYWQKRTLEALGLTKLHKTMIHKNIPSVNGMLASVKELIKVQPVVLRTDVENSPSGKEFISDNAEYFVREDKLNKEKS